MGKMEVIAMRNMAQIKAGSIYNSRKEEMMKFGKQNFGAYSTKEFIELKRKLDKYQESFRPLH